MVSLFGNGELKTTYYRAVFNGGAGDISQQIKKFESNLSKEFELCIKFTKLDMAGADTNALYIGSVKTLVGEKDPNRSEYFEITVTQIKNVPEFVDVYLKYDKLLEKINDRTHLDRNVKKLEEVITQTFE